MSQQHLAGETNLLGVTRSPTSVAWVFDQEFVVRPEILGPTKLRFAAWLLATRSFQQGEKAIACEEKQLIMLRHLSKVDLRLVPRVLRVMRFVSSVPPPASKLPNGRRTNCVWHCNAAFSNVGENKQLQDTFSVKLSCVTAFARRRGQPCRKN